VTPPQTSRQLIVTADDFGVDIAVNEAVEKAHIEGILTCASLMMGAGATQDAVERAHRLPTLGVGLHLTLADGRPTLPPEKLPGLVDRQGRFRDDLVGAGIRWFFNPFVRGQLAREIEAQFQAFVATGLALDHVNVHKHLHLHPTVASMIIRIGRRYGMPAIRIPDEPNSILAAAAPGETLPRPSLRPILNGLRRKMARAGIIHNNHVFGLAWSGHMTEDRLLALMPHLPPGLNEIYTHPATADSRDMPHAVPEYQYRAELKGLLSGKVRRALIANNVTLRRFSGPMPQPAPVGAEGPAKPA
jgi:hopanoid biosynthesis associated protein HpnK